MKGAVNENFTVLAGSEEEKEEVEEEVVALAAALEGVVDRGGGRISTGFNARLLSQSLASFLMSRLAEAVTLILRRGRIAVMLRPSSAELSSLNTTSKGSIREREGRDTCFIVMLRFLRSRLCILAFLGELWKTRVPKSMRIWRSSSGITTIGAITVISKRSCFVGL
jgi:hypothetical protein